MRVVNTSNEIYIFDEPTSNLDAKNTEKFFRFIKKVKNQTIIVISHNLKYKNYFNKIIKI